MIGANIAQKMSATYQACMTGNQTVVSARARRVQHAQDLGWPVDEQGGDGVAVREGVSVPAMVGCAMARFWDPMSHWQ